MKKKPILLLTPYNSSENLYIENIKRSLVDEFDVKPLSKTRLFSFDYDVLYLNWIENISIPPTLKNRLKLTLLKNYLKLAKKKGKKIIWTMHNKLPHESILYGSRGLKVSRGFIEFLLDLSDIVIVHSKEGREIIVNEYNIKNPGKIVCIPHGNYINNYAGVKKTSKSNTINFGYFGQIRPYKQVEKVIDSFLASDVADKAMLYVIGKAHSQSYADALYNRYGGYKNIFLDLRFVDNHEIPNIFSKIDVLILSYDKRTFLTSGSAILSFSLKTPVIAPKIGMFRDFEEKEFVFLYNNEKNLIEIINNVSNMKKEKLIELGEDAYKYVEKKHSWLLYKKILLGSIGNIMRN